MNRTFPAEFSTLMAQYRDTRAGLGDDHPVTRRLWLLVEATAPLWFLEEMRQLARTMNLIPTARTCNAEGEPVFTLAELAEHLGVPVEEAEATYKRMLAEREALGLPTEVMVTTPESLSTLH